MAPFKNMSLTYQAGKFFIGIGAVVAILFFILDPRASIVCPGLVLVEIGLVLLMIGWFRHPGRRR
ncbi:hypothetical protein [Kocuria tytonicola]|uniref:hypothetical protein n=1 Tax=Kocuria tytonicola TaxID=2055946 RepID=UPI000F52D77E|nr:hypothetical protein [Kocuria tytonicola]